MPVPATPPNFPDSKRNHLLAALGPDDYQALMSRAEVLPLKVKKRLYGPDNPLDALYFPLSCVVSLLVGAAPDRYVEVATIGNEGTTGAVAVLEAERPIAVNVVQISGFAVRIDAQVFRQYIRTRPAVERLIRRYLKALIRQIAVTGACNRLHRGTERCARWLLTAHDHVGEDSFTVTQEFLSTMLAVRRATVNSALGSLKKAGRIRYVRGRMTIVSRAGLESVSCQCYTVIRREYEWLKGE